MSNNSGAIPDRTAVLVALWRALHVQVDPPPHVLDDEIGLKLLAPGHDWLRRPDMDPRFTKGFRASMVARSRFIEDLVVEQAGQGIGQYVILGAGLDSFAQRRPQIASRLRILEVDRPGPQAWKRRRLIELGFGIPDWLQFVPVDFEAGGSWWEHLQTGSFDGSRPAVVASAGVSMYLTKDAIAATLRQIAVLAPGSTLVMTFILPVDYLEPQERPWRGIAEQALRAGGTPFISVFSPEEMLALIRETGFREARHVSAADLTRQYFAGRTDGLRPSSWEALLVAKT